MKKEQLTFVALLVLGVVITLFLFIDLGRINILDSRACETGGSFTTAQPQIKSFDVSSYAVHAEDKVVFSWSTINTDKVTISAVPYFLPSEGTIEVPIQKSGKYSIKAYNGGCYASRYVTVNVTSTGNYPWTLAIIVIFIVLILDATRLAVVTDAKLDSHHGNIWITIREFLEKMQRKKPWGIVYDSTTKEPIVRAIIRLFNENGGLVETAVSDANGVFKINPKKGTYSIKVVRNSYTFPSTLILTNSDGAFSNVYHGGQINIASDNQPLLISIPLDPTDIGQVSKVFRTSAIAVEAFLRWASIIGAVIGSSLSVVYAVQYPNTITLFTLAIFSLFTVFKLFSTTNKPKDSGIVRDTSGKIVPNLEIGIFENDFNTIVARTFTDSEGKYSFIVPRQEYHIQIMDQNFSVYSNSATELGEPVIVKASSDDLFIYVTQDLTVGPKKAPDMPIPEA